MSYHKPGERYAFTPGSVPTRTQNLPEVSIGAELVESSSMVERRSVKALVEGSSPSSPANKIVFEGRKDDLGKDGFEYLPADALGAINQVLIFGAKKYGARNWEKGMNWTRPANAALRHLFAWLRGEKADKETGFSHLWHLGCCVLFLIAYELRAVGEDDRC